MYNSMMLLLVFTLTVIMIAVVSETVIQGLL